MRAEFLIERQGKQHVLFAGLLDAAHGQGLKGIATELLQIPSQDNGNVAIVQATVTTEKGSFQGIGDASLQNVSRQMLTCLIRMAETRAKARALRDAINIGAAAFEELDGEPDAPTTPPAGSAPTTRSRASRPAASAQGRGPAAPAPVVPPAAAPTTQAAHITPEPSNPATTAQIRMIEALARQSGQEVNTAGISQREASQLITELKAQAQGRAS